MNNNKILIVFASRYGTTTEIATTISEQLKNLGLETDFVNIKELNRRNWPKPIHYKGIIIGTSVKIGKWTKEIKKYIEANLDNLRNSSKPVAFFITSGYASDPDKYEIAKRQYIVKKFSGYGVTLTQYDAFGGVFDLSETSKFSWLDKKIIRELAKTDNRIKINGKNDFRDWEQIHNFTHSFFNILILLH